jgi:hypothetical protein
MKSKLARRRLGLTVLAAILFSFQQSSYTHAVPVFNFSLQPDFGNVQVGTLSGPISVTATVTLDVGFGPLSWSVTPPPAPTPFSLQLVDCQNGSISCIVNFFFLPTVAGPFLEHSTFLFTQVDQFGNFPPEQHSASLNLTGTGVAVAETPLPAALPLFATGLGALGLLGWRRKRKAQAAA